MLPSIFITGTDTGVGKTLISCALLQALAAQELKVIGMKPVASGSEQTTEGLRNTDALALQQAANVAADYSLINPYCFAPAIAPHLAARQAGVSIELPVLLSAYQQLQQRAEVVVVEGAGGFLTPINAQQSLADLAQQLAIPIILVVGMRLGCINHALLTVEAIQARGLRLAGWVANSLAPNMPHFAENLSSLQQAIDAPCLSVVPWQGEAQFNLTF